MKKWRFNMDLDINKKAHISKEVTEDVIRLFAEASGDFNPVHLNEDFAQKTRFRGRIAHGMLGASLISAVLGTQLPGPGSIYISQTLRFLRPVRIGDTITAEVKVTEWDHEKGIVKLATRCHNQRDEDVIVGDAALLVEETPG
jgi:3-hydroxybutyryl-CoA dehydratase